MPDRPAGRSPALILAALGVVLLTACAAPVPPGEPAADAEPAAGLAPPAATVPDLVGRESAMIDKAAAAAQLVPLIEHVPCAAQSAGTVLGVTPAPGTQVPVGSTITVTVAGAPGDSLDDLIAADRRHFVGLGADPDGTLVVAVTEGSAATAALQRIAPALAGRKHRVVRCATSWAQLARVAVEVAGRADVRTSAGLVITVDPAACAVRVTGDIPATTVAALEATYASAVVVEPGEPARRAPRT